MRFINRQKELKTLENAMKREKALIIIYGRRRIGKTSLIRKFIENKDAIYIYIPMQSEGALLRYLAETLYRYTKNPLLQSPFSSFRTFIEYITSMDKIIVLDEFQRLEKIEGAISIIQDIWDSSSKLKLILTGSSIGMIHRLALSGDAPLFGRRTATIKLGPLEFETVASQSKSLEDAMEFYGVFGGTPAYIQEVDFKKSLLFNVKEAILKKASPLHSEPEYLIRAETRETNTYMGILKYLSLGKNSLGELSDMMMMERNKISFYLSVLEKELDIIKRTVPVTEKAVKSRKSRYFIKDPFFRFWFKYIFPYETELEMEKYDIVLDMIKKDFPTYIGKVAEEYIRDLIAEEYPIVGSWWNRKGEEIDIVALNEKEKKILFGEIKWKNRQIGWDVIEDLKRKAEFIKWNDKNRKEKYFIFSKSGFTKGCVQRMDDEEIIHQTLEDIIPKITSQ